MFARTSNAYHPSVKPVAFIFATNDSLAERSFQGVAEGDLWKRPTAQNNPMLWIFGHMVSTRANILKLLGDDFDTGLGDVFARGAALTDVKYRDRAAWQTVCEMYRLWPFFQATIENAALALVKADMYIGQRYSELCPDKERRERIWTLIASEFDRSRQAIMDIGGPSDLTSGGSWLKASLDARNPYIDPLNLMQIEFLARRRALPAGAAEHDTLRDLLRLTVQGIASGMRTTG